MHIIRAIASMFGWVAGLFGGSEDTSAAWDAYYEREMDKIARDAHIDHFGDHDDQIGQGDG